MSTGSQIVLGALIAVVLLLAFYGLRRPKSPPDPQQQVARLPRPTAPATPITSSPSRQVIAEARRLVADGRKIQAIKLVREHTNWGLKEAKDYVERL